MSLTIYENQPVHFNKIKKYFANKTVVQKVNNADFSINENYIDKLIQTFSSQPPNVYAILIKRPSTNLWSLKYIGRSKSGYIKQRLREHLISCSKETGSKLDEVKKARENGFEIGIKLVSVQPDSYRLVYEEMLIEEFKEELEWNEQK